MMRIVMIAAVFALRDGVDPCAIKAETLSEAWAAALATNGQLAAAEFQRDAAQFDVAAAQAGQLPVASVSSAYNVRSDERRFRIDNPLVSGQQTSVPYTQREAPTMGAVVCMPLYAGGRISNPILSAEARLVATSHSVEMSRLRLRLAVGEAYVAVLRAESELIAAEQNLASLSAHEHDATRQFDEQRVSLNDLLAAQVSAAGAAQLHLQRSYELQIARAAFNRLVGRPLDDPVLLEPLQIAPLPLTLDQLQKIGCQRRPDLAELCATANSHAFDAERLRAASRPQLSAVGRYDFEENRYQSPQDIYSAALVVDWRVYDGNGSRRAAMAEQARAAGICKLADDLRSQIALEVLTAWNNVHETSAPIAVAREALERSAENVRVTRLHFTQGLAVGAAVLEAHARQAQAGRDYFNAHHDLCLSQLHLHYASGLLGDGD
jgi:outer membrane protein TolC